jgi:hypothetical protein
MMDLARRGELEGKEMSVATKVSMLGARRLHTILHLRSRSLRLFGSAGLQPGVV